MSKIPMKSILKTVKLKEWADGEDTITVRQATTGDNIHLAGLFAEQTRIWDDDEVGQVQLKQKWNMQELIRERAFRTVVDSTLTDEDDNPIFRSKTAKNGIQTLQMSHAEFIGVWDSLPLEVSDAIYQAILEVNPQWNPNAGE